jgi:hypothetical protein
VGRHQPRHLESCSSVKHTVLPALVAIGALTVCAQRAALAGGAICAPVWIWLTALAFAALFLATLRWLKFDAWLMGILVCATLLYLNYAAYTDLTERNYDGLDHYFYANYIAAHGQLPPVTACIACGHPPLYPLLGAVAIAFARWTGLSTAQCSLQGLSLLLSLAFVVLGVRTLQCCTAGPVAQRLGAALLAFWPTSVTQSVRVHDDVLLACLGGGILYSLVRWQKNDRSADLAWAVALTGLAVFTKANAYAWVLLLLAFVTTRMIRDKFTTTRVRQAGLAWVVSAASILVATELRAAKVGTSACHRAIGAICDISSEHFVGNTWANYLTFDIRYFLAQPYLINDPYDPRRDYFLNTFLKSSLLSAMPLGPEFDDRLSAGLAILLSYLALVLILYLLLGLPTAVPWRMPEHRVLLLASLFMLGPLVALRAKVPLSMHADFRYVFPLLVPACVWYSKVTEYWQRRSKPLFLAGGSLVGLTVLGSVLFFRPSDARAKGHLEPALEHVGCSLAAFSEIRSSGTSVKDAHVLRFGPRQLLEFPVAAGTQVSHLDVSLDADDQYEITIRGRDGARRILVGPTTGVDGLMRYQRVIQSPLQDVHTVTIRAVQSDGYYALGHLGLAP